MILKLADICFYKINKMFFSHIRYVKGSTGKSYSETDINLYSSFTALKKCSSKRKVTQKFMKLC